MAKLRHIAIATKDPDATAEFYKKHFEMKEVGTVENDLAEGVYLSDGVVNLAVIKMRSRWTNLPGEDINFTGIHHFGFIVEDLEESMRKLERDGARQVADGYQGAGEESVYYERKFLAPDGVVVDLTDHGWAGARGDV